MTIELPQLEGANVLTHSSESAFKACPRRYYFRYRMGLVPSHDSDALRIGSAFHKGIEVAKAGGDAEAVESTVRALYADQTCPPWMEADEFAVEHETAVAMALGWHERWKDDLIVDYVAVEESFDLPIINPETGYPATSMRSRGKIDGIARLPDGRLVLVEHKTTGDSIEPNSDYWLKLQLDSQISRYMDAARRRGHEVVSTIYDVTRKPSIRPKAIAKADRAYATSVGHYFSLKLNETCPERETPRMYGARLRDDMRQRPEFYFVRNEIPRLQEDLDAFATEQWTIKNMIGECVRNEKYAGIAAWPRFTNACTSPYACTYLEICKGMRGDPNQEIPNGFKITAQLHPEFSEINAA